MFFFQISYFNQIETSLIHFLFDKIIKLLVISKINKKILLGSNDLFKIKCLHIWLKYIERNVHPPLSDILFIYKFLQILHILFQYCHVSSNEISRAFTLMHILNHLDSNFRTGNNSLLMLLLQKIFRYSSFSNCKRWLKISIPLDNLPINFKIFFCFFRIKYYY